MILFLFFCSETANIRAEVLEIEVDTLTKEVVAGVLVCACVYACAWLVSVPSCLCVCVFVSGACTGVDRKARVACASISTV